MALQIYWHGTQVCKKRERKKVIFRGRKKEEKQREE